ncbi:type II toxin-antitoxin system RelE/ParE family toxin [Lonepinella koalarum]|uniref:Phage-related protein n=1 Tax=Lonepinella koalarum TaxID=53417 RepID=A0A4R1KYC5_9PAST|nr:type II toxin-antitoxin system RelE/ParE family toxin [Lonepinella koalarum]MDH2926839.1 hypothetical protein [Lonepinella koalarum]TCK70502.1 phage-related protein [Lonepinella koalarum]TFJ90116.1 type II toxin-antitoxin system RelE/ParE family toxin [Lonepinella koalarum]
MFELIVLRQAEKELDKLPDNLQAKTLNAMAELQKFGYELHEPVVRHIRDGLKELRVSATEGNSRSFFFFERDNKIIVVHVLQKKTQKTPQQSIDLALTRMNDYKKKG